MTFSFRRRFWVGRDSAEPSNKSCRGNRCLPRDDSVVPYRSFALPIIFLFATILPLNADPVVIGSKKFTESYVLGEIAKRTLSDSGIPAEHREGMGGTIILWQALRTQQIDAYPEYTGTIAEEILKDRSSTSAETMRTALAKFGIGMTKPLGFNNTYTLVMRREEAQKLNVRTISDLKRHPELQLGLTHEFLDRQDGWRPLSGRYQLNPQNVIGIDHALGSRLKTI